jgi:hypothetical protein
MGLRCGRRLSGLISVGFTWSCIQIKRIEKKLKIRYIYSSIETGGMGVILFEIKRISITFRIITLAFEPPKSLRSCLARDLNSRDKNDTIVSRECKEIMDVLLRSL